MERIKAEIERYVLSGFDNGALMIIGEWGVGKTYTVKKIVKSIQSEQNVTFLWVSLYGIDAVDMLHKRVKEEYLHSSLEEGDPQRWWGKWRSWFTRAQKKQSINKGRAIAAKMVEGFPVVGGIISPLITLDILDFLQVGPNRGGRVIVLVFDDLERCDIDTRTMLGCINKYLEEGLRIVVISNESKLIKPDITNGINRDPAESKTSSAERDETYAELKEKVISRTVKFEPSLRNVIEDIICEFEKRQTNKEIAQLLRGCLKDICTALECSGEKNMRSVKYAFACLERLMMEPIYAELNSEAKNRVFLGLLICVIENKSGKHSTMADIDELQKKIFTKYTPYMELDPILCNSIAAWIIEGTSYDRDILVDFERVKHITSPLNNEAKFLYTSIFLMNDDDFNDGFSEALNDAENGKLTLNQYLNFLSQVGVMNKHGMSTRGLDHEKIRSSIESIIQSIYYVSGEFEPIEHYADREIRERLTEENLRESVSEIYRYESRAYYYMNRRNFLCGVLSGDIEKASAAIRECRGNSLLSFDKEMLDASIWLFDSLSGNEAKSIWCSCMLELCERNDFKESKDRQETKENLTKLREHVLLRFEERGEIEKLVIKTFAERLSAYIENNLMD